MNAETFPDFPGLLLLRVKAFRDERGAFMETWRASLLRKELKDDTIWTQDNVSVSKKGVIRGLHFQNEPNAQKKLVTVLRGGVWDVVVDLRHGSPGFGKHIGFRLDALTDQLLIPRGFAHGFAALEEDTVLAYKVDSDYAPGSESGLAWNDPSLAIRWPVENPLVNAKDAALPRFDPKRRYF